VTGREIRRRFLEFFRQRDHLILDSAPLVPLDDPTTLYITAGMQPLQPYYQGLRQPPHPRLASCQKGFRTTDIDSVGPSDRHNTFFEMLGNFAPTGDYFKERAIPWAWEFVTDTNGGLGLLVDRIRVTVHPTDKDARQFWLRETGVNAQWVYDNPENFWPTTATELGACGPDSEMWWDRGVEFGCGQPDCYPDHCDRFLEFWNLVFPQFDKQPDGSLPPLRHPGIDTGMGLERIASIAQDVPSNFDTDLFAPIVDFLRDSARKSIRVSERVVADHLRGMTFVIGDGVLPSSEGRGYVLRRIIRRAALHARRLDMSRSLADGVPVVVEAMRDQYPYLVEREADVTSAVASEQDAFNRTLERGMELFEQMAARYGSDIPGYEVFKLHDTFGFPLELTRELAQERGLRIDEDGFGAAMDAQRERSRSTRASHWADVRGLPQSAFTGYSALNSDSLLVGLRRGGVDVADADEGEEVELYLDRTPFYAESGGQVGDTGRVIGPDGEALIEDTQRPVENAIVHMGRIRIGRLKVGDPVSAVVDSARRRQIMRHHTATHLVNKALEELLGARNLQRGSLVCPDHATFDFPLDRALTPAEIEQLQDRVNEQVRAALPMHVRVLPHDQAVATGATHLFEEKYGDSVRVVCFGNWSCEFCGGTHCDSSADVGFVLVLSEGGIGRGLRRLDFTVGESAERLVRRRMDILSEIGRNLGVATPEIAQRLRELRADLRSAQREIEQLRERVRVAHVRGARTDGGVTVRSVRVPFVAEEVPAEGRDDLRAWADRYLEALGGTGVVVVADGANFVIKVSRDLSSQHPANRLAQLLGRGGGRPELAEGKLTKPAREAFNELTAALQ
jgi:alanyl-tRNA synthetase